MSLSTSVRILVAEDDPLVLMAVEEALTEAGFEVVTADSGAAAIKLLDETPVVAVLTDIRMGPGPSGWDVGRHARERAASMPVIYVSGDSADAWPVHGVPKSVMLSKPFAFPQLITALSNLLNAADQLPTADDSAPGPA